MAFLFFERCRSCLHLHKRPCFLFETVKLKDLLTGRLLLRDRSRLITAGPGYVIRKLIKVYLKLLISPWKVYLKYCIRRLLLIKQWRERLSLTSFKLYCGFSVVISNVSQHAANMQRRWNRHCDIISRHDG